MRDSKNFIVLGGSGYIGSKLVDELKKNYKKNKITLISRSYKNKRSKIDLFNNYRWFNTINNKSVIYFLAFENNVYFFEKNFYKITKKYNNFLLNLIDYLKYSITLSLYKKKN